MIFIMKHIHIEGTGKPVKVVAPEGISQTYLTIGKEYTVIGHWVKGFKIIVDIKETAHCTELNCLHLNGGNWIVTEREAE